MTIQIETFSPIKSYMAGLQMGQQAVATKINAKTNRMKEERLQRQAEKKERDDRFAAVYDLVKGNYKTLLGDPTKTQEDVDSYTDEVKSQYPWVTDYLGEEFRIIKDGSNVTKMTNDYVLTKEDIATLDTFQGEDIGLPPGVKPGQVVTITRNLKTGQILGMIIKDPPKSSSKPFDIRNIPAEDREMVSDDKIKLLQLNETDAKSLISGYYQLGDYYLQEGENDRGEYFLKKAEDFTKQYIGILNNESGAQFLKVLQESIAN